MWMNLGEQLFHDSVQQIFFKRLFIPEAILGTGEMVTKTIKGPVSRETERIFKSS